MEQPRLKVESVPTDSLIPYAHNAKEHPEKQVGEIAASIEQFGFSDPVGVWTRPDGQLEIVEGHGRVLAAQRLGIERVPIIRLDHLDDDARRAYAHVHNQTTLTSGFNWDILNADMAELPDFDWGELGFPNRAGSDFFQREERWDDSREEGNEEYNAFLDKFEQPKTTDDCYTPENVYEAVADFVAETYGVARSRMVRPFYPGGDYQAEKYAADAVVVDNPPFSILAEILRFYMERGIGFFLFCPGLVGFSGDAGSKACAVPVGAPITYENKATVVTSFITNLEDARIHTYPKLYEAIEQANKENEEQLKANLPKYDYPPEVCTASGMAFLAKHGQEVIIGKDESVRISALDAQKSAGKAIFGGGYLISEEAAKKKAAAQVAAAENAAERAVKVAEKAALDAVEMENGKLCWKLSDREREIVRELGQK